MTTDPAMDAGQAVVTINVRLVPSDKGGRAAPHVFARAARWHGPDTPTGEEHRGRVAVRHLAGAAITGSGPADVTASRLQDAARWLDDSVSHYNTLVTLARESDGPDVAFVDDWQQACEDLGHARRTLEALARAVASALHADIVDPLGEAVGVSVVFLIPEAP